jgi:hypothetical protein
MRGDDPFPGNMDTQLRGLGMPLKRDGGMCMCIYVYICIYIRKNNSLIIDI